MAEVKITIKDLPTGGVEMKCEPSFETMMQMMQSGHDLESSHGYAISCANVVRELSKQKESNMIIKVPKLGKA